MLLAFVAGVAVGALIVGACILLSRPVKLEYGYDGFVGGAGFGAIVASPHRPGNGAPPLNAMASSCPLATARQHHCLGY
jgi:hypothetical protein